MPSDKFLKAINGVHRMLLKVSGERLGWTIGNMPVLELTTIGRKSGNPRSVMLTSPHRESDLLVIVASKGGEDTHPAWFLNLRANPHVAVTMKGDSTCKMIAQTASPEERRRLWPIVTERYPNYARYQARTAREIPLVMLKPAN